MSDRVSERRRAAQLARHYRDQEDLTIAEIARRLGRAEATIKAYLYDPSYAYTHKRPTDSPQERQFWALAGHARTSICRPLLGSRCDDRRHEAASRLPDLSDRGREIAGVRGRQRGWIRVQAVTSGSRSVGPSGMLGAVRDALRAGAR